MARRQTHIIFDEKGEEYSSQRSLFALMQCYVEAMKDEVKISKYEFFFEEKKHEKDARLMLEGDEVHRFFEDSIEEIKGYQEMMRYPGIV